MGQTDRRTDGRTPDGYVWLCLPRDRARVIKYMIDVRTQSNILVVRILFRIHHAIFYLSTAIYSVIRQYTLHVGS